MHKFGESILRKIAYFARLQGIFAGRRLMRRRMRAARMPGPMRWRVRQHCAIQWTLTGRWAPPPMPPEDLYAALGAAAGGDIAARNRVVIHGLGLARYVVRKYAPLAFARGIMSDELMQQAALGLIGAAETYRPGRGAAWSTYAVRCIANRVQGWLDEQLRHLRRKVPLDVPARGRLRSIAATMPDYDAQADMDAVIDRIAREQASAVIRRALAALPEDEYEVTTLYFGFDPRARGRRVTVRDVADMLGVPVHYVTSRLARARYRLRKLLPRDLLEVY